MEEPFIEIWNIHDRINHYLLAAAPPEALAAVSASKAALWTFQRKAC